MDRQEFLQTADAALAACRQAGKKLDGLRWSNKAAHWVLYYNDGQVLTFTFSWRQESYMQLTTRLTNALLQGTPYSPALSPTRPLSDKD